MSQAKTLYQLQKIDLEIRNHQKRLQEIEAILANDEATHAAQAGVDAATRALAPLRTRQRDLELETRANEDKSKSSEQQLYSGAIKNTKEMQDMQQEIVSLKKRHDELETMILETMMQVEEAEAALATAEAHMAEVAAARGDEHRQLLEERGQLEQRLDQLREERPQVLREITPENRKLYDTMKVRKHNQPVAVLEADNTCSICGVVQTITIVREVAHDSTLVHCSNCERILVSL